MIARLTGVIDGIGADWAIVDVGGVGYLTHCSGRTLARLQTVTGRVVLQVETHVREDAITLYGFADTAERDWFRLLTGVQGVGGKVALAVLSVLGPDELTRAIAAEDRKALTRADGVGPRLAARLVTELADRVRAMPLGPVPTTGASTATGSAPAPSVDAPGDAAARDAISALVNLGYGRADAYGAVAKAVQVAPDSGFDALVRAGLKELAG